MRDSLYPAAGSIAELTAPLTRWRVSIAIGIIVGVLAAIALVGDLRGTDQYWYLTDTETLMEGKPAHTHSVFPGPLLRGEFADATPIVHNGPLLYFNAWVGQLTGALWAWKLTNVVWLAAAAVACAALVDRYRPGNRWHFVAPVFMVVSPLSVWLTANLLQETFYAFLVAVMLYGALCVGYMRRRFLVVPPLLLIGVLAHPLFAVLGVALLVDAVIQRAPRSRLVLLTAALVIGLMFKDTWFPSSFPPTMLDLIVSAEPGGSNILWHLMPQPPSLSIELMVRKLKAAVTEQFLPPGILLFSVVTLGGMAAWIWLALTGWRAHVRLLGFSLALYGAWIAMIILTQPQLRYQMLISPAAVPLLVLAMSDLTRRFTRMHRYLLLGSILVMMLLVDAMLLNRVRTQSNAEAAAVDHVLDTLDSIGPGERVVLYGQNSVGRFLPLHRALAPRPTLFIETRFLSPEQVVEAVERFRPTLFISGLSRVTGFEGLTPVQVIPGSGRFGSLHVFRPPG